VFWASTVLEFSSQMETKQFAAKEVLGPPNAPIQPVLSAVAWAPEKEAAGSEFITVGFDTAIYLRQATIVENFNPGAIAKVYAIDTAGEQHLLKRFIPINTGDKRKILKIKVIKTKYLVNAIRIELQTELAFGRNQIDAVGISAEVAEVNIEINQVPDLVFDAAVENLGSAINSEFTEGAPVVAPDGQSLFFTREKHPENRAKQAVWYSVLNADSVWDTCHQIGAPINNNFNNNAWSVQPGGNDILFQGTWRDDGALKFGYFLSHKEANGWSTPEKLKIKNYYNLSKYSGARICADGKTLLLELERKDTRGGRDIYVSFLLPDGRWSEPLNLGPEINTAALEASPFLAADMSTMYFASKGYPGYGGRDIFMTKRLDSTWTHWSTPQNLGPVINTPGWDGYYTITAKGDYAYFTGNREDSRGKLDLYRVKLPEPVKPEPVVLIKGKVYNARTNQPLGAAITWEDLNKASEIGLVSTDPNTGDYQIVLPYGKLYGFFAQAPGFFGESENLDLGTVEPFQELEVDLYLVPIVEGETIRMNNIFFDFDKATLRKTSHPELDRVVDFLDWYPSMTIEVAGHTDSKGSDSYNQTLSEKRAQAVVRYLLSKGVQPDHIEGKGYGESKPVEPNTTEAGRQRNRRVEFVIVEVGETVKEPQKTAE